MTRFEQYINRQRARFPGQFQEGSLVKKFIPLFNSGERIEVRFSCGTVKRGTVSATGGWRPEFMLMLTARSQGSSWLLREDDTILKVKRSWGWTEVKEVKGPTLGDVKRKVESFFS